MKIATAFCPGSVLILLMRLSTYALLFVAEIDAGAIEN